MERQTTPSSPPKPFEDEIDLRIYIDILLKWWREILVLPVLVVVVALIFSFFVPKRYEARVLIAVVKTSSEVTLEPKFVSVTETDLQMSPTGRTTIDRQARMAAFAEQVYNPSIAETILKEHPELFVKDNPNAEPTTATDVLEMIKGEIVEDSDLIAITVTARNPEQAATIANAWGEAYVKSVNQTYSPDGSTLQVVTKQAEEAKVNYDNAVEALRLFINDLDKIDELNRLVAEKETIITSLRTGKNTAVTAIVDQQIKIQSELIQAYLEAGSTNRLLAFNKSQEAKRTIVSAWLNYETENRLAALKRDQNLRQQLYNKLVETDLGNKMAVFNEQAAEKLANLSQAYARKDSYQKYLVDTQALLKQIEEGGDASAASNNLAIQLLKAQVFAHLNTLPPTVQLQMSSAQASTTARQQSADLTGLITALENQITATDKEIETLSSELLNGTGYEYLDQLDPNAWTLTDVVQQKEDDATPDLAAYLKQSDLPKDALGPKILQSYTDLSGVGLMSKLAENVDPQSPLFAEVQKLYPTLFDADVWTDLVNDLPKQTELITMGQEEARRLLNLEGLNSQVNFSVEGEEISKQITTLEQEVRALKANISRLQSNRRDLEHDRDLAWESYSTLSNKQAELVISSQTADSEIRFAVPAIAPSKPASTGRLKIIAAAGFLGLMTAVFGAFLLNYFEIKPFLKDYIRIGDKSQKNS